MKTSNKTNGIKLFSGIQPKGVNAGLLNYPILMVADILLSHGAEQAEKIAKQTIKEVKRKMGLV